MHYNVISLKHRFYIFFFRKRNNRDVCGKKDKYESCEAAIRASRLLLEKRLSSVDVRVPPPTEVLKAGIDQIKYSKMWMGFPSLDSNALNKELIKRLVYPNQNGIFYFFVFWILKGKYALGVGIVIRTFSGHKENPVTPSLMAPPKLWRTLLITIK